jgi:DUF1680 family protein
LYIQSWTDVSRATLEINAQAQAVGAAGAFTTLRRAWQPGDTITLDLAPGIRSEPALEHLVPAGLYSYWHGPLLLGLPNQADAVQLPAGVVLQPLGAGRYQVHGTAALLAPIEDLYTLPWESALHDRRQVLFTANR